MFEKQHVCSLRHRQNETLVNLSTKQRQNACSRVPPGYQDLSTRHDCPVKKAIVDLPIGLKGNSKHISHTSLRTQNKDISTASQTLLTRVKLCLRLMLHVC